jgi:hypothetical protein
MRENTSVSKPEMFLAITTTWMLAAVSCTALPFLHAVPGLQAAGQVVPLLGALALGIAAGVPLSLTSRYLCGLGATTRNVWGVSKKEAALFGVLGWGIPVGLVFALHEFLMSASAIVAISSVVVWPLGGVAFGLAMRWFARRGQRENENS